MGQTCEITKCPTAFTAPMRNWRNTDAPEAQAVAAYHLRKEDYRDRFLKGLQTRAKRRRRERSTLRSDAEMDRSYGDGS